MKKNEFFSRFPILTGPILVILLGLLLLINPDSASALISMLLGGLLTLVAVGFGIAALVSDRHRIRKLVFALMLFSGGGILSRNPLLLASFAGRVVGILLFVDGLGDMLSAHRNGVRFLMPLLVTILGGVLVLMPMTASRLVFSLCGLVVVILGVSMLLERIRFRRLDHGHDDPNIIDAL